MNIKRILFLCVVMIAFFNLTAFSQNYEKLRGYWLGVLKVQSTELRIVMKVSKDLNDSIMATIDSPDQGVKNIKVDKITYKNDTFTIKIFSIYASFKGVFRNDTTLEGKWLQAMNSLPVTFIKKEKLDEDRRPQEPIGEIPYNVKDVVFENVTTSIKLSGTLTFPKKEGKFPAVVLISGSGRNNRNEEVFGHKPFWIIADHLTRQGFVVLRYDKRGVEESQGNYNSATSLDFANDATAAFNYLKTFDFVDTLQIGLIGHSEGGLIAPMIASQNKNVAFIVLLAGPGVTGDQIILKQTELIARAEGTNEEILAKSLALNTKLFEIAKKDISKDKATKKMMKEIKKYNEELTDAQRDFSMNPQAIQSAISQLLSPWMKFFIAYDPVPAIKKLTCPTLVINGDKDLQVYSKQNIPPIENALKESGNKNYRVIELQNLNHLFQYTTNGAVSEYVRIEETFSPHALEIISAWMRMIVMK